MLKRHKLLASTRTSRLRGMVMTVYAGGAVALRARASPASERAQRAASNACAFAALPLHTGTQHASAAEQPAPA
jgi:hypothetical protein